MKSKKIMFTMLAIISVLLTITFIVYILNIANIDITKIALNNNNNVSNNEVSEIIEVPIDNENTQEEENEDSDDVNRPSGVEDNLSVIATLSSRSDVNRLGRYVYLNENQQPEDEYEELKEYKKIEDVQISFDMDVSQTTGLSKEDFIKFVQNMKTDRTGILAKNAGCIWELCQQYSVNEIFVLGICGIESAWCTAPQHQNTHNYSSLMTGGHLIPYPTDEAGFEAMIKLLGENYLKPTGSFYHGATITGVGKCYCDPTSWPGKVYTCMQQAMR